VRGGQRQGEDRELIDEQARVWLQRLCWPRVPLGFAELAPQVAPLFMNSEEGSWGGSGIVNMDETVDDSEVDSIVEAALDAIQDDVAHASRGMAWPEDPTAVGPLPQPWASRSPRNNRRVTFPNTGAARVARPRRPSRTRDRAVNCASARRGAARLRRGAASSSRSQSPGRAARRGTQSLSRPARPSSS
jgi:hypothetical protein